MENYEALYLKLFNGITDVIDELKNLQTQVEEMYINNKNNDSDENA